MATMTVSKERQASLREFLTKDGVKQSIAMALPAHMTPDRMTRIALTAAVKQPLLLECSNESIYAALLMCSEMGLEPNGRDAHLIPFKNKGKYEVQLIPDYRGLIKLAYQSGSVTSIMARAVRQHDAFEYQYGTDSYLRYKPADGEDRGPLTHAWAMATLKGGGSPFVVLSRGEVLEHKRCSRAATSDFSPWNKPETEPAMWAKTAVRELSKFIPLSPQLERAINIDIASDIGGTVVDGMVIPPAEEPQPSKSEQLAQKLSGQAPPASSGDEGTHGNEAQAASGLSQTMAKLKASLELAGSTGNYKEITRLYDDACGPEATLDLSEDEMALVTAWRKQAQDEADKAGRTKRNKQPDLLAGQQGNAP